MRRRIVLITATVSLIATAVAVGAGGNPPTSSTVRTAGAEVFKANERVSSTLHFTPGHIVLKSGGTLGFTNTDGLGDPHTLTVVAKQDLPNSLDAPCPACDQAFGDHFPQGDSGPLTRVVNHGAAGFNTVGDSLWVNPGETAHVKFTAPAGTTLYFVCAIHTWMQGSVTAQ